MAEQQTTRIIEVEAKYETLASLRKEMESLKATEEAMRKAVEDGKASLSDYEKATVEAKKAASDFSQAQRIAVKEVNAEKGSYNDLVNQLTRLKEAWKATGDVTKRKELTDQINNVKTEITDLDHSIGNWQRNVGNYAMQASSSLGSLSGVLSKMGPAGQAAASGVNTLNMGFKALAANPAMLALTAIAAVLSKIVEGFRSSESAMNSLSVAFAPLKAGGQAATLMFQKFAEALGKAAEWMTQIADKMGWLSDRQKENMEITKEEIQLRKDKRRIEVENAKLEMEAAEARTAAADKANLSAQERIKLLQSAADKQKAIAANELAVVQKEYEIASRKAELTHNDAATNDELASKEAALYQARTGYANKMREITSQMAEAQRSLLGTAQEVTAAVGGEAQKLMELRDGWQNRMDATMAAEIEARKAQAEELAAINALIDADYEQTTKDIEGYFAEQAAAAKKEAEDEAKAASDRKKAQQSAGKGIVSVMTSVAAAMQASIQMQVKNGDISEEEAERQFKTVKAFQYATTLINTFAGVTQALTDPAVPVFYLRAINAAAVLASGIASTIQIASTSMGSQGTIATSQTPTNIVAAPVVQQSVPVTRNVTNAEDEQKINERTQSQRVYILSSDIEASQNSRRVQVAETTF